MLYLGGSGDFIDSGDNTYGGKYVINPSGGLISKGHPLGATGIAQCVELCLHLRNLAGERQVPNAKIGLQHNLGSYVIFWFVQCFSFIKNLYKLNAWVKIDNKYFLIKRIYTSKP